MAGRWGEKIGWFCGCLLMLASDVAANKLRRGDEPYMYKRIVSSNPQMFPFVSQLGATTAGDDMMMLVGTTKEDSPVTMKTKPVSTLTTRQNFSTGNNAQDVLENMVEVMEMEEEHSKSKDDMLPKLKKMMMETVNATTELQTRMAPQTSEQPIINFEETIRQFLAISGIDALLPLDCGKNPTSPEDPLPGFGSYPWVAALGSSEDGRYHYRCTGVLITEQHILTDADCVTSPNINVVLMNVSTAPGPGAIVNYVAGRRVHPAIRDDEDLLSGNNIGILELAFPYEFNEYVQPICLAGQLEEPDPTMVGNVTIIGFDSVDTSAGRTAGLYNWPNSKSLGSSLCYVAIKELKEDNPGIKTTLEDILTKKHICVDRNFEQVGKSVILKVDENTGRVRVVGLGGVANASKTNPIAYTLVQPHRFWVELVLKKFRDNTVRRRLMSPPQDSEL